MAGDPFRNMIGAAETFVNQLRDGDRVSVIAFSDGVYEAVPPIVIDPNTRGAAVAEHPRPARRRRHQLFGRTSGRPL